MTKKISTAVRHVFGVTWHVSHRAASLFLPTTRLELAPLYDLVRAGSDVARACPINMGSHIKSHDARRCGIVRLRSRRRSRAALHPHSRSTAGPRGGMARGTLAIWHLKTKRYGSTGQSFGEARAFSLYGLLVSLCVMVSVGLGALQITSPTKKSKRLFRSS